MTKKKTNNKNKYITEYNKEHYKQLKVYLQPDEYNDLEYHLERLNVSKVQFIRDAINNLKNK
jgi:hypothetical protein